MPSQLSFLLGREESIRFENRRFGREKDQQLVTSLPGASRCSDRESGDRPFGWEWVPLCRGIGERGLSRPRAVVGFAWWPQTQRLGGWPVKLQLSRSCAACRGVQCSCFPGDETRREIRDRQQIQGETSRDELWFPTKEGKVVDASTGFAVWFWSAHDSAVRTACWVGQLPVGCQIKSVSKQGKGTSE